MFTIFSCHFVKSFFFNDFFFIFIIRLLNPFRQLKIFCLFGANPWHDCHTYPFFSWCNRCAHLSPFSARRSDSALLPGSPAYIRRSVRSPQRPRMRSRPPSWSEALRSPINKIMENVKAPRLPKKKNRLNLAMSEAIGPAKIII